MKNFRKDKKQNNVGASNEFVIYGRHAVYSAIKNKKRVIKRVVVAKENLAEFRENFGDMAVDVVDKKEFMKIVPVDAVHQGFALYCSRLETYDIRDLVDEKKDKSLIVILDQVSDPQNIGAIIRSCVAFGVDGLVVQDKNSPVESGAMVKAAAGTMEHIKISRVTNLSRAIEILKDNGYWVVGMDGYADTMIDKVNKDGKIALVMGSEGKGMRRLVQENCDTSVKLNISPLVESLNVSTAAAIAIYELTK